MTPEQAINALRERLDIPQQLDISDEAINADLLTEACRQYGKQPAVTSLGHTLTFEELEAQAKAFAIYLQQHSGLQPGDRLAIQLPNVIQYPVVLFGALKAGLVAVNINPLYTDRELEHQFNDSGAKAIVVVANVAHALEKVLHNTSIETVIVTELADLHAPLSRFMVNFAVRHIKKMVPAYSLPDAIPFRRCLEQGRRGQLQALQTSAEDLLMLQYTGGTTGLAKGAMITRRNLFSNINQCEVMFAAFDNFSPGEQTTILPLPLYHIYAFMLCMLMVKLGNHSILIPNPRDLPGLVKELRKWRFSCFCGLNTLFVALCGNEQFRQLDFSALKVTVSGGMALTGDAAKTWKDVTGSEIYEGYGLTETSPVVSINTQHGRKLGSIGVPLPSTRLRVVDDKGQLLGCGEAGELCVHGPQVMRGYWQQAEKTAEVLSEDGWLATGDIAIIDEDGFPRIVDRKKDMIIVSGFNVYPNEVEDIISSHPQVTECAVIGLPDPRSGEKVKVFIVRQHDTLQASAIIDYAREQLAAYKVPDEVEFVDDLPKSNVGKILRRELRQLELDKLKSA